MIPEIDPGTIKNNGERLFHQACDNLPREHTCFTAPKEPAVPPLNRSQPHRPPAGGWPGSEPAHHAAGVRSVWLLDPGDKPAWGLRFRSRAARGLAVAAGLIRSENVGKIGRCNNGKLLAQFKQIQITGNEPIGVASDESGQKRNILWVAELWQV